MLRLITVLYFALAMVGLPVVPAVSAAPPARRPVYAVQARQGDRWKVMGTYRIAASARQTVAQLRQRGHVIRVMRSWEQMSKAAPPDSRARPALGPSREQAPPVAAPLPTGPLQMDLAGRLDAEQPAELGQSEGMPYRQFVVPPKK